MLKNILLKRRDTETGVATRSCNSFLRSAICDPFHAVSKENKSRGEVFFARRRDVANAKNKSNTLFLAKEIDGVLHRTERKGHGVQRKEDRRGSIFNFYEVISYRGKHGEDTSGFGKLSPFPAVIKTLSFSIPRMYPAIKILPPR